MAHTRTSILADRAIPHVAKLTVLWLAEQPHRVHTAKEIGAALGTDSWEIVDNASCLRGTRGITLSKIDRAGEPVRFLPMGDIMLTDEVYTALQPAKSAKGAA